jgi:hypothetical protein
MKLYEEFKEYEKLWDNLVEWKLAPTNTNTTPASNNTTTSSNKAQEILGCELEDIIDNMEDYGRFPRIPLFWFIDDIDDTDTDSNIMFSHRKLPIGVQIWAKYYYEDGNWSNCYYKFDYEVSIDGDVWEHPEEKFGPNPEDLIKRFCEIVTEFDKIFNESRANNFKDLDRKLKAAGYHN